MTVVKCLRKVGLWTRVVSLCSVLVLISGSAAFPLGDGDPRMERMIDPDHFELRLPEVGTLAEWEARKEVLRETLLLRAGLWPEPEKTPLNAKIFDERRGDGFTVAKVYFESLPGFFATGNLYRPTRGSGPYPAVITPHGHWQYGRLQNSERGSIPGRCIDFARMGFVVFSIDMVGYNDSFQLPHDPFKSRAQLKADEPLPYEPRRFRGDFDFPEAELYGFNLGGLQLWNAIRGVDFLCSLPEVDADRIGVTGASGGASQTIFLMIADERIKVAAPVNIIGAAKHPGCRCENMPGLWLDMSTVELAAAFSPKPLLLMSATEDPWTNKTPEREYPLIRKYYSLYGAGDMVRNVHIVAGHNYNAETRAAVYEWFCRHLKSPFPPIKNPEPVSSEVKALGDLRVFPDRILPENAISGLKVIENWKEASERAFEKRLPKSPAQLDGFVKTYRRMLRRALAYNYGRESTPVYRGTEERYVGGYIFQSGRVGFEGKEESFFGLDSVSPAGTVSGNVLLACPRDDGELLKPDGKAVTPRVENLLKKGWRVFRIRGYANGELSIPLKVWDSYNWSSAYNPSNELYGIHDITTALDYIKEAHEGEPLVAVGLEKCGLLTAFAGAASGKADRVMIDLDGSDPGYDGELVRLLPVGGIKRTGDFRTAMLLLMRKPVTVVNAGPTFDGGWYRDAAERLGLSGNLDMRLSERGSVLLDLP